MFSQEIKKHASVENTVHKSHFFAEVTKSDKIMNLNNNSCLDYEALMERFCNFSDESDLMSESTNPT